MAKSKPLAEVDGTPKKGKKEFEDYEIEGALSDIERAEKHKANPKLMKHVGKLAGRKVKALKGIASHKGITSIDDIRAAREEKFDEDKE